MRESSKQAQAALILLVAAGSAGCPAAEEPARKPPASAASSVSARRAPIAPPSAPAILHLPSAESPPDPAPAASAPAAEGGEKRACRVAVIGDSLTDYRSHGGGFIRHLEARCPESELVNYGKGGDMVNQMRRRFEAEVLPQPPGRFTHVVVFGGVNDLYSDETAGRTPQKVERDLGAIYDAAHGKGWRVVALTVAPWGGFGRWFTPKRGAATLELNYWIRQGPADVVVDAYALLSCGVPTHLCAEYARPHADGLHFGKGGHEKLGQALYDAEFKACR